MATHSDPALLSSFDSIKDEHETILWVGKPKMVPFLFTGIVDLGTLIFGAILLALAIQKNLDFRANSVLWILAFACFAKGIYTFLYKLLSYSNTFYGYSDRRIFMRTGFVGTDFKIIDYDKISDMEVTVNLLEKIYNVGTVKFFSGRIETNSDDVTKRVYDKWEAISHPYLVFKKVKEVTVDIKTDFNYPNALRPDINPGYTTTYKK